jgi:hypothetical protein
MPCPRTPRSWHLLCAADNRLSAIQPPSGAAVSADVSSLPIGLLLGWLLVLLAGHGYLAAALLLPLYYLTDATITLLRRLMRSVPITQAHRSHYYQRALANGLSVFRPYRYRLKA